MGEVRSARGRGGDLEVRLEAWSRNRRYVEFEGYGTTRRRVADGPNAFNGPEITNLVLELELDVGLQLGICLFLVMRLLI
jgi:hypothetical protein